MQKFRLHHKGFRPSHFLAMLLGGVFFGMVVFPHFNLVSANTISEGFNVEKSYTKGSLVSINKDLPDDIELASLASSRYLLGVVSDKSESTIIFEKENSNVSIALSGEVRVLVSDANGEIKRGDFVGASWLPGVGMLAISDEEQKLVGIAQEDFNSNNVSEYGDIKTPNGTKSIKVSSVLVRLFDKEASTTPATGDGGVEKIFSSALGKDVSLTRILLGSLLLFISLSVVAMFVTSSVRGSFISIGRNPMASNIIQRSIVRVAILAVTIIVFGSLASYAVMVV